MMMNVSQVVGADIHHNGRRSVSVMKYANFLLAKDLDDKKKDYDHLKKILMISKSITITGYDASGAIESFNSDDLELFSILRQYADIKTDGIIEEFDAL